MKSLLAFLLALSVTTVFGQKSQVVTYVGIEQIDIKDVKPWVVKQPASYVGTYYFGYSEWESEFELQVTGSSVTALERRYPLPANGSSRPLPSSVKRFTHTRIVGRRFYSDQLNGEFVSFGDDEGKQCYELKVYPSWNFKKRKAAEIGV